MDFQALATVFNGIFLAELGDKTQLATVCFTAEGGASRREVFLAAGAALVLTTLLGVIFGAALGRLAPPWLLKAGAGIVFLVMGLLLLREGWPGLKRWVGKEPPCA